MSTFEIRMTALQDHFRQDHNQLRYKSELKTLKQDVGRHCQEDDNETLHLYRVIARELSFVTGSRTTV